MSDTARIAERLVRLRALAADTGASEGERENAARIISRLEREHPGAIPLAVEIAKREEVEARTVVRSREADDRSRWADLWRENVEADALYRPSPEPPKPAPLPTDPPPLGVPSPEYLRNKRKAEAEEREWIRREQELAERRRREQAARYSRPPVGGPQVTVPRWRDDFGGPAEVDRFTEGGPNFASQNARNGQTVPVWRKGWGPAGGGPGRGGAI